jgi:hypothetical protein
LNDRDTGAEGGCHFFAEPRAAATSQECQEKATECLRLVWTSLDATNALLLEMAQAWITLAEQQKAQSE